MPPLRAGRLVLKLRNEAKVERQFALIQLQRGRTIEDLRAWIVGQLEPKRASLRAVQHATRASVA